MIQIMNVPDDFLKDLMFICIADAAREILLYIVINPGIRTRTINGGPIWPDYMMSGQRSPMVRSLSHKTQTTQGLKALLF